MRKDKKQKPSKKKLEVRKQTVRELSKKDLTEVAGGIPRPPLPTLTGNCY